MGNAGQLTSVRELGFSAETADIARQALDEGVDCASDGEVVIPFVMTVSAGGTRKLHRLMAADLPGAEAMLRSLLSETEDPVRVYAFVTDTFISSKADRSDKRDAIVVEFAERGVPHALVLAQFYQRANDNQEFGPMGERELLEKVRPRFPESACATSKSDFSPAEWETLLRAPILAFLSVAAADGDVDRKELAAFGKQVSSGFRFTSALLGAICSEIMIELEPLVKRTVAGGNPAEQISAVAKLVDARLDPVLANEFKLSILYIAKQVAEASGGFFGFGSKISKEEQTALMGLAMLLQVKLPGQ